MPKEDPPLAKWRQVLLYLLPVLLVIAADQLTKDWIRSYPEGYTIFRIAFFRLVHGQNTGAAFGIFQGHSFALTIVAILGITLILLYAFVLSRGSQFLSSRLSRVSLALILGGTLGNLIDRIHVGNVTDFIDFSYWPAFNLADMSITVGAILFAYSLLFPGKSQKTSG
jgi:signal peptidase II